MAAQSSVEAPIKDEYLERRGRVIHDFPATWSFGHWL